MSLLLLELNVHYRVHKSPMWDQILRQLVPAHNFTLFVSNIL